MQSLTVAQVRKIDRLAAEQAEIPSILLMENAAINASAAALDLLNESAGWIARTARVAIFCGSGNNGGDGLAIARHLLSWGVAPMLFLTRPIDALRGDARIMAVAARGVGLRLHTLDDAEAMLNDLTPASPPWDLSVDAILGTGATGEPHGESARAIQLIGRAGEQFDIPVLAVDVPSGFDARTGRAAETAVFANVTVSFVARKTGFDVVGAERWTGRVVLADIGLPETLIEKWLEDGLLDGESSSA